VIPARSATGPADRLGDRDASAHRFWSGKCTGEGESPDQNAWGPSSEVTG